MDHLSTLVQRAVETHSERVALITPTGEELTYQILGSRSRELAGRISESTAPDLGIVAICLPKSSASVTAILACVQARRPYLPLDPDAPSGRNAYIVRDAAAHTVLTTDEWANMFLAEIGGQVEPVDIGPETYALFTPDHGVKTKPDLPDQLAYILYTSGSTGRPKGVMITHANALCFIEWSRKTFSLLPTDVLSSIAPFHFDLSVFDLYAGLGSGATVVLIDPETVKNPMMLAELITRHRISVWYATPTTLKMMLRFGRLARHDHTCLRTVLFAGEVFPVEPLNDLRANWPQASFHNLYGPTETNVCTWHSLPGTIERDRISPYPIGQPCPYATCYLDVSGVICGPEEGMEGELVVGGQSVMAGYLGLPERNATAFVDHNGDRCYRTGDLVKAGRGGILEYMGRVDRMIKRNGYRIELGEIEAALHRHPDISAAGVVHKALGTAGTDTRIFALYATTNPEHVLPTPELQAFLQRHIPSYMLPDQFIHLPGMPMTSSHKIDYPSLLLLT